MLTVIESGNFNVAEIVYLMIRFIINKYLINLLVVLDVNFLIHVIIAGSPKLAIFASAGNSGGRNNTYFKEIRAMITKGKWEVVPQHESSRRSWLIKCGSLAVARIFGKLEGQDDYILPRPPDAEAQDNAEFICKAVNCHADLLEACKKTEWVVMDKLARFRCPVCMNSQKNGHRQDCELKQAIAKAEKE